MKKGTNKYYLSFKRVKIRGRSDGLLGYFNHPFEEGNEMRLLDDINLDITLSEESLSSDFEGIVEFNGRKGKRNAKEREVIDETDEDLSNYFNLNKAI